MTATSVTVLHVEGCPNVRLARDRLAEALDRLELTADIAEQVVGDAAEAAALGFRGSPTILIDGQDPFPATYGSGDGLTCRLYRTPAGTQGAPTVDDLVETLSGLA